MPVIVVFFILLAGWKGIAAQSGPGTGRPEGMLLYPWAGGLNSCQFCSIDLNLDGRNDLLLFDRHGNRKLTFINHGTPNTIDYTLEPEYARSLPELHDWVITADFDCDGKMDIFTYGNGGVRVFRNTSGATLSFTLVTDLLESFYYTGKVGILVTPVDYPAIADIDGDGDLDFLTFFGLGSFVEYHRNLSMEKYGHCDSLDFRLEDPCWGKFRESEWGNRITLNAGCEDARSTMDDIRVKERHTGSTMLAIDLNHDGLKDLVLGDVDFPGLIALYNGGTPDSAHMIAMDTLFPAPDPVHLFSFPVASSLDINNDGLNDLLVSPFDPAFHIADNYHCIWFYRNTGSPGQPIFEKQPGTLFRDEMMDFGTSSHPVLYDVDCDGLTDLLVGNYGLYDSSAYLKGVLHSWYSSRIAYFRNTGTASAPVFSFVTDDLAGVSQLKITGVYPAPGDVDGDGITDLLAGQQDSSLIFFHGTGIVQGVPVFEPPVFGWQGLRPGNFSAPQLFDLDKDGLTDVIVGRQDGKLSYYRNTGKITNPGFTLITHSLGNVDVSNPLISYDGFCTPCFTRKPDGGTFLIAGSDEGHLRWYEGIDGNLTGSFTEETGLFSWLSLTPADSLFGWQTSPAVSHLTDNESFDLITGNFSGGLNYLTKRSPATIIPATGELVREHAFHLMVSPNPADQQVMVSISSPHGSSLQGMVTDLTGRTLLQFHLREHILLDLSGIPSGLYFVKAGESVARLVILHP